MSKVNLIESTHTPASLTTSASAMATETPRSDGPQATPGLDTAQVQASANNAASVESSELPPQLPNYEPLPVSELPSYNEALKLKKMAINEDDQQIPLTIPPSYYSSTHPNPNFQDETRIVIDPADVRNLSNDI